MNVEDFRKHGKEMIDYICNYANNIEERDVAPTLDPGYLKQLLPGRWCRGNGNTSTDESETKRIKNIFILTNNMSFSLLFKLKKINKILQSLKYFILCMIYKILVFYYNTLYCKRLMNAN